MFKIKKPIMRYILKIYEPNILVRKLTTNIIEESDLNFLKLKKNFKEDNRSPNGNNLYWNNEYEIDAYNGFDTQFGKFFGNLLTKDGEHNYFKNH
jgi:hypothetical protein